MKVKAFVDPTGLFSPAMVRIARALERYAPDEIEIVTAESDADLIILYVIGPDYLDRGKEILSWGHKYAVVQCCLLTAGYTHAPELWHEFWTNAEIVWSYYDLVRACAYERIEGNFYYAPLGVDDCFSIKHNHELSHDFALTTGCVSGPSAEALAEVWRAAAQAGLRSIHVGPASLEHYAGGHPDEIITGISDSDLAQLYSRACWVCSLRHVEGFELPALEALSCGTRAVLFDQSDLRHWYGDHAVFVSECHGDALIESLSSVFNLPPVVVSEDERIEITNRFAWKPIVQGFWTRILAKNVV